MRRDKLYARAGAVAVKEYLVCDSADISFGDSIDLVEIAEELAPVTKTSLVLSELMGQAVVVSESAQQVGSGSGLEGGVRPGPFGSVTELAVERGEQLHHPLGSRHHQVGRGGHLR